MHPFHVQAAKRASEYATRNDRPLNECLGFGWDGIVFSTISETPETAVKALRYEELYTRELEAYQRLEHFGIRKICGFVVPRLINHDDSLWIVEMGVVSPPCILDFAGAFDEMHPNYPQFPSYSQETRDAFGERWEIVQQILSHLRDIGIHFGDARPTNIIFEDDDVTPSGTD